MVGSLPAVRIRSGPGGRGPLPCGAVPTEKRQRKREGRQARLEAAREAAARSRRRRRIVQVLVLVAVVAGVIGVSVIFGGGDDDDEPGTAQDTTKPEVEIPEGDPPTELRVDDLEVGEGDEVAVGDTVEVHYVGVLFDGGEEFDASWDRGQPFSFTVGAGGVIQGWDDGVVGMKVGGRRRLVIPPELAYGESGQSGIPPDSTLVFVIDLLSVEKGN